MSAQDDLRDVKRQLTRGNGLEVPETAGLTLRELMLEMRQEQREMRAEQKKQGESIVALKTSVPEIQKRVAEVKSEVTQVKQSVTLLETQIPRFVTWPKLAAFGSGAIAAVVGILQIIR